jgi:hypothetical protein
MLYKEIIAVCSQIHTKHINTVWVERRIFMLVKKKKKSDFYLCHVCLSIHLQQLGSHWKNFHKISTSRKFVEKIQFSLKCDKKSGHFTLSRPTYIYDTISFSSS